MLVLDRLLRFAIQHTWRAEAFPATKAAERSSFGKEVPQTSCPLPAGSFKTPTAKEGAFKLGTLPPIEMGLFLQVRQQQFLTQT